MECLTTRKRKIPSSRAKARSCQYPTAVRLSGAPRGCIFESASSECERTENRIGSNKMQHFAIPGVKRARHHYMISNISWDFDAVFQGTQISDARADREEGF